MENLRKNMERIVSKMSDEDLAIEIQDLVDEYEIIQDEERLHHRMCLAIARQERSNRRLIKTN